MKKWLPFILVLAMAAWVVSSLSPGPERTFRIREFGRLPVLMNGRIQPFDSVARNSLLQIRNKQSVAWKGDKGYEHLTAGEWLTELMMKSDAADDRKVFRIDNPEMLGMLKLPEDEKHFSFNQLKDKLDEISKQAGRIDRIETSNRTPFEKQVLKLQNSVMLYQRLKLTLHPPSMDDFAAELDRFEKSVPAGLAAVRARDEGKKYDEQAFNEFAEQFTSFNAMAQFALPLVVPPAHPEISRQQWENAGTNILQTLRGGDLSPAMTHYAAMVSAYDRNDPEQFNNAVRDYNQWLRQAFVPEVNKARAEFFFNDFQVFYKAMVIYVFALILALLSLACFPIPSWAEALRRSSFWLIGLAWVIHTFGLIYRMALEGRPPVTNLYSSAIFIGWAAVLFGAGLERTFKTDIGNLVAALAGFVTLVIAHNLALGGDTMEMMRAVLDTNFWLATHVVVVTLGYAATFVAGTIAIIYILLGVFTPNLTRPMSKRSAQLVGAAVATMVKTDLSHAKTAVRVAESAERGELGETLAKMAYGIVCFATLFSFTGTVLGGIWADQSWGRFWGWDPKENGALLIVIWNAAILHARWDGMVKERGLMNMAVFGNIVTSFSWFGVNMLGVGLHSYGFMDAAFKWLMLFVCSQVMIIGLGLMPLKYWLSFQERPPGDSAANGGKKASPSRTTT